MNKSIHFSNPSSPIRWIAKPKHDRCLYIYRSLGLRASWHVACIRSTESPCRRYLLCVRERTLFASSVAFEHWMSLIKMIGITPLQYDRPRRRPAPCAPGSHIGYNVSHFPVLLNSILYTFPFVDIGRHTQNSHTPRVCRRQLTQYNENACARWTSWGATWRSRYIVFGKRAHDAHTNAQ